MKILALVVVCGILVLFCVMPVNSLADPSFTARTETYANALTLSSPYQISVNKPTGTAQGDILFALICFLPSPTGNYLSLPPSGWTELGSYVTAPQYDQYYLYYKIAGASEPSSYIWEFEGSGRVRIVCSCYTGGDFDADDPIDVVSNTAYRINDVTVRAATMTVSAANSPLVFFASAHEIDSHTFTKPSAPTTGWVEDDDAGSVVPDFWNEICSMIWAGSGATGNMNATITGTGSWEKHAFAVALNPAGGGPAGVPYSFGYILGG